MGNSMFIFFAKFKFSIKQQNRRIMRGLRITEEKVPISNYGFKFDLG